MNDLFAPDIAAEVARLSDKIAQWRQNGLASFETGSQTIPMIVSSVTAAYTFKPNDRVILADATGGAFTVTLPSAVTRRNQQPLTVKRLNGGGNAVTVGSAGGLIDGASTYDLTAQYETISLVSNGTDWMII